MKLKLAGLSGLLVAIIAFVGTGVMAAPAGGPYPETAKRPVTDTYHSVTITDNYRWLENFDDPAVQEWLTRENAYTKSYLEKIPSREPIMKELNRLLSSASVSYYSLRHCPGLLFALKYQPPKQQPFIVALASPDSLSTERVVVDPNALDTSGQTSIDFYEPSSDGRYVAASLSYQGSEDGTLHIFDVATGKQLPDSIPRVNFPTAGGSVAWAKDNSGFWYTRYPAPGEQPEADIHFYQQVYFHKLGTPLEQDAYQVGKDFPKIAEVELETSHDGNYVLARVKNGDGGELDHYLLDPTGKWTQLTKFSDKVTTAYFGQDQALYMLSKKNAPKGQILRMPLTKPEFSTTKPIVRGDDGAITDFTAATSRLYVVEQVGGPERLKVFDLAGKPQTDVPVDSIASISRPVWLDGDEVMYNQATYLAPSAWFKYDPATGQSHKTQMIRTSVTNFDDCVVERQFATSKDGTKIPLNIIHKKGFKLDGQNPTILYGYGGYGVNETPGMSERNRLWYDNGGVYAAANIRGGGEYGEEWHEQGNLTNKQNVFDDFAACAQYLIDKGYTNPKKLGIEGGSNGGLLMGATLTQHPDLMAAVVSYVGIYDMLRVELSPNGLFNTTEFGTVKDPEQFKALYAYSPYHHVVDGKAYPGVLLTSGDHDGRVDPMQSRKMAARLQAATSSDRPILLRTSSTAGHGIGMSLGEEIVLQADVMSFFFDQLGMQYKPAERLGSK